MAEKSAYYTRWRGKATQKSIFTHLEQVRFRVKKGKKDLLKEEAERAGQSLAQYIIQAVNDRTSRQILKPSVCKRENISKATFSGCFF